MDHVASCEHEFLPFLERLGNNVSSSLQQRPPTHLGLIHATQAPRGHGPPGGHRFHNGHSPTITLMVVVSRNQPAAYPSHNNKVPSVLSNPVLLLQRCQFPQSNQRVCVCGVVGVWFVVLLVTFPGLEVSYRF